MSKRRAQGEGSVFYDESRRRWVGLAWVDGRRRKVSAVTKTEAVERLGKLIHGDPVEARADRKVTVATLLDDWQRLHLAPKDRAPGTKDVHAWAARIISTEIGKRRVADLDARDVDLMLVRLATRKDSPLGKSSLIKIRSTLRQALAWGQKRRLVAYNAAAAAELPVVETATREKRALSSDEATALTVAMVGHPYAPLLLLSLRAGLRPGEAAGVCVDALDLDAEVPTVAVVRAVRLEKARPTLVDVLKTDKSRRTVAIPADLVDALGLAAKEARNGLLVTAPDGGPVWPSTVRSELTKLCRTADIESISPNELRHTAATRMADAGVAPHAIADVLGHTSTRMVDAVYRHRPTVVRGADSV